MNDAGPIAMPNGQHADPLFQPGYSQFCYELPSMPGQTVISIRRSCRSGILGGYNNPDCAYPDATPAIGSVTVTGGSVGRGGRSYHHDQRSG